ncbi:hypothetical protein N0V93_001291 [Gnomoniopsis smithogilvyi]|uniref:J domain-containing protein n=1 Tax=Gnomoniopsis smithogilvyi TaxID=1191159 RepID=A0A9W9D125_9PEZI|nr:hypothetical protein N0V93_001291 [Gnomoniopsis smithogilvyi]
MASGPPPNYYAILEIQETATTQQIRDAYKRAALKTHPDRVPAESPERASRTRKFQLVNDAYYTLSDSSRRREYDSQRKLFGGGSSGTSRPADPFAEFETGGPTADGQPGNAQSAFSWAWNFFTNQAQQNGGQGNQSGGQGPQQTRQEAQSEQFGDVFEEMLREEGLAEDNGTANGRFWGLLGGGSGAALGFIVANVPGALAGAVAGNRLGAIRDAKGKSVYAVFQELPQGDRARLLSQLAARVFSHAVGI